MLVRTPPCQDAWESRSPPALLPALLWSRGNTAALDEALESHPAARSCAEPCPDQHLRPQSHGKAKALLPALSHPPWLSIWFQNLPLPSCRAAHPSSTGSDGAVTPSVSMRSHTHRCCASVRAQRVPQLETLLLDGQFKAIICDFMIP